MKIGENSFVALDYKLEVDGAVADQSQPGNPLKFAYGMGMLLPKFEAAIAGLKAGDDFKFTLSPADGYGETITEAVVELPRGTFEVNGAVEDGLLTVGNVIPMADAQGNRLLGRITKVEGDKVTMDFNHPMAGKTLNFTGKVVDVREVTPEDLAGFAGGADQGGCDCGCGDGGDCSCDDEKKKGCGCN